MTPTQHLVAACLAMTGLTFVVALRMFRIRVGEMMARRIHPQSVALSGQRAERLQDSRASARNDANPRHIQMTEGKTSRATSSR